MHAGSLFLSLILRTQFIHVCTSICWNNMHCCKFKMLGCCSVQSSIKMVPLPIDYGVCDFFVLTFGDTWYRGAPVLWPSNFLGSYTESFVWGHVKTIVYDQYPHSLTQIKDLSYICPSYTRDTCIHVAGTMICVGLNKWSCRGHF
jgi:hypothetical protein